MTLPVAHSRVRSYLHDAWTVSPLLEAGLGRSIDRPADVAPFTPAQVRSTVGYVEFTLQPINGADRLTCGEHARHRLPSFFAAKIYTPRGRGPKLGEERVEALCALLTDLDILEPGPPQFRLFTSYEPPQAAYLGFEHDWIRNDVTVLLLRDEKRTSIGAP